MKLYNKASRMLALLAVLSSGFAFESRGQIDTVGIYGERQDSLVATVVVARQSSNFLSKGKEIRTEVITAAGLCKMACCNLAESFENSASVTVGYSDAVTGARQIRLLGQSGIYTQMLDENRPTMRGVAAPWGLNFVPGQWLESIQIAKGVTSVINGVESMTGQINLEHRKPTDEKPLYVQASYMNDSKADLNIVSSLQLDPMSTWSTVLMGHIDGNFKTMDHNGDGFMDDPKQLNIALSNRWLYYGMDGVQVRFGIRAIQDRRTGGQMEDGPTSWRSNILNRSLGGYVKVGVPLNLDGSRNFAMVADYTAQGLNSQFGINPYNAVQHSVFANFLYQDQSLEDHHFTLGFSEMLDIYNETFAQSGKMNRLSDLGAFGEYTYHNGEVFSAILGLRADWYNTHGLRFSPRLTLKWAPSEHLVLRANGGRGLRYSMPIVDNIGILSTNKKLLGDLFSHPLEDAWTMGANATWYIGESQSTYLSLDFFHTEFKEQLLVDNSYDTIRLYNLSSINGGRSYSNNLQLDFNIMPLPGFTITLTGRLTDAKQSSPSGELIVKPMTSLYKGVLNLQYATNLNKWIFDFTASVNGPCRVWDFITSMPEYKDFYPEGKTAAYPLLYAQITRRFKGFDIYLGGENLSGFTQPNPIISADNPYSNTFDASCIWGPLMGARFYAGIRMTIWKTE